MKIKKIEDITKEDVDKEIYVIAQIKSIKQTSGPTIFHLKDKTGSIKATGFISPGTRAFPSLSLGSNIQAKVLVKERHDKIELEILSFSKVKEDILKRKKSFLIQSKKLDKMRPSFEKAAKVIDKAIMEKRPIVIRHHDDTDGYASGIILERAILTQIHDEKAYLYVSRNSSRTPYYDYIDALRDLNSHLISKNRYNRKTPLIILTDLGSNRQSLKSIERLKIHGIEFIIVDHHRFDKQNQERTEVFLNPHAYGFDSNLNAGALATELALFINPDLSDIKHIPALTGTADKSQGEEYEQYVKISGIKKEHLEKWATVIDHETYYMKFQESTELLEDLFYHSEENKEIIPSVYKNVKTELDEIKEVAKKYVKKKDFKTFTLLRIDRGKASSYGNYGSTKLTKVTHDLLDKPRITMAEMHDSISFRADGVEEFSVVDLLQKLREKFPFALIDGGGHDFAGNIIFNNASKEDIVEYTMKYLSKIDKK